MLMDSFALERTCVGPARNLISQEIVRKTLFNFFQCCSSVLLSIHFTSSLRYSSNASLVFMLTFEQVVTEATQLYKLNFKTTFTFHFKVMKHIKNVGNSESCVLRNVKK